MTRKERQTKGDLRKRIADLTDKLRLARRNAAQAEQMRDQRNAQFRRAERALDELDKVKRRISSVLNEFTEASATLIVPLRVALAKRIYESTLDDSIHCNRYPSWEELAIEIKADFLRRADAEATGLAEQAKTLPDDAPHAMIAKMRLMGIKPEIIVNAYGWTFDVDGNVCGLTAGDMGYEDCGIKLDDGTMAAVKDDENRVAFFAERFAAMLFRSETGLDWDKAGINERITWMRRTEEIYLHDKEQAPAGETAPSAKQGDAEVGQERGPEASPEVG